ncbi:MAG TPA: hypothetical protein VGM90_18910 [Kofleriaceae bacterium]|jgi:hypothetical protein
MRKLLASLGVFLLVALSACADEDGPTAFVHKLTEVGQARDCDALRAITAPELRDQIECTELQFDEINEIMEKVNFELDNQGRWLSSSNGPHREYIAYQCINSDTGFCHFEIVEEDGTWYLDPYFVR